MTGNTEVDRQFSGFVLRNALGGDQWRSPRSRLLGTNLADRMDSERPKAGSNERGIADFTRLTWCSENLSPPSLQVADPLVPNRATRGFDKQMITV